MTYGFVNGQRLFTINGAGCVCDVVFNIGAGPKNPMGRFDTLEKAKTAAQDVLGKWLSEIEYEEGK